MNKRALPDNIDVDMRVYRALGRWSVPASYVAFHQGLAVVALEGLVKERKLVIHRKWIKSDGWCDGMNVVWAIVEEPSGRLVKLSWHDGNQEFFEHGEGSWSYRLKLHSAGVS